VLGHGWDGDASAPGGPLGWAPLLYVTHSCFASVELARELLARGADPNATFTNSYGEMSAVYGAAGVVHDLELTRLPLEAGASPDDGESLYHSTEAADPACLKLLLAHGANPLDTGAIGHAIDYDRREHVTALLDAGADPNEQGWALLVHAVRRGCGPEMLRLLAERGEAPAGPLPERLGPDAQEVLILAAPRGRLDTIVDALGPGFFGHVGDGPAGTLLHHACWVGNAAIVARLLERGADPVAKSGAEFDTPAAWAALGSQYHATPGRDYVAVIERLLAAGAELEPRFVDVAARPLADWLDERWWVAPRRRYFRHMETSPCPVCGAPVPAWERYPRLLCAPCQGLARDAHDRPLRFSNETALGAGFVAEVEVGGGWRPVDGGECWVAGRRCVAGEHRFGGIVVQAVDE
jgi:ankyrin repeat protein